MTAVDPGIEDADVGRIGSSECCATQQVLDPCVLIGRLEGIEKLRSLLGAADFGNLIEKPHGLNELPLRPSDLENGPLGKADRSAGDLETGLFRDGIESSRNRVTSRNSPRNRVRSRFEAYSTP